MANGNNAVVSAKASLNEARGMFLTNDLTLKKYNKVLKKASNVLTPVQIQNTIKIFDNDFYSEQRPMEPQTERGLEKVLESKGISMQEFNKQFQKDNKKGGKVKKNYAKGGSVRPASY